MSESAKIDLVVDPVNGNVAIITASKKYLDSVFERGDRNFDAMCVFVEESIPKTAAIQAGHATQDFPMNQWDLLVPQAMLTINILSAHKGIYGSKYDFGAHPIYVARMRSLALR